MAVDINYWLIIPLILAVIILIAWLIKRDHKDAKAFEKEIIQSELPPEKHDDDTDKEVSP